MKASRTSMFSGFVGDLPLLPPGAHLQMQWEFDCTLHAQVSMELDGDDWVVEVPIVAGTRLVLEARIVNGGLKTILRPASPKPDTYVS